MPLQATSGAASYDAFGGGVAAVPNYIEDVFSTYLYTGNSSTQTITNGIDLSTNGGLVWIKGRDNASTQNNLYDTNRGIYKYLQSNTTDPQTTDVNRVTAFNSNGFSIGAGGGSINRSPDLYVSWTFRKAPKFFDVVTYTGDGNIGRTVAHSLGSVPGCIIVKQTNAAREWAVYHTSLGNTQYINLNSTGGAQTQTYWNNTSPTSTNFTVGDWGAVNQAGSTYVAYLFAHNAGGFGLTGTDNVISCGSVTADGSGNATVNLGYEPQWILIKSSSEANGWAIVDTMRGLPADGLDRYLLANSSAAEAGGGIVNINATGFYANATLSASATYIYIAIRRGPMKVPTDGTSVFAPVTRAGTNGVAVVSGLNFPPDLVIPDTRTPSGFGAYFFDRLRGTSVTLYPWGTGAEITGLTPLISYNMNGITVGSDTGGYINSSGSNYVNWNFARAPGFFDEVCYTGTGSATTVTHNLGVTPEFMIAKARGTGTAGWWVVYHKDLGYQYYGRLESTAAFDPYQFVWNANPTSSVFSLGVAAVGNASGVNFVWYGFATCAGVSKVGSYTGNGTTQTIDCGFTGGSRFVLIKRTDSTGDWYVWDSARGIVAGNDPYLLLNSTAAEVTSTDYIDTYSAGFEISSTAPAAINASGGTFIFLAIA